MESKNFKIRDYITKVLNGMAWGIFASLLIGLIIKQLGTLFNFSLLIDFGNIAQRMMGPAIGVAVAYSINAPSAVIMATAAVGAIGAGTLSTVDGAFIANIGEPVGAFVASLIAAEAGKRIAGKTKVDIVLVPLVTILVGGFSGVFISPVMSQLMKGLGAIINAATELRPIPMGIIVSVMMGMILTLPISSAAIAISLNLSGLAAGAATVGCCANMIGFAIISYRENKMGGAIAQGLGTSMLQVPNIIKKPIIWIPPIIASAILGPISSAVLKMESIAVGAGMGTSGLVGQFAMIERMGASPKVLTQILIMHFLAPAIISLLISEYMRKKEIIKFGDMKLM
ncbi:MAG: PTS sugar transporter subunit IIC [Tissierellia bacterium]|nr:PTS sugar transporter subunit IIC [Tissierellia bacterium]